MMPSTARLLKWGMISNGVCITANISEYRSSADGCILSDILMDEVAEKYFLSERAQRKISGSLLAVHKAAGCTTRAE